MFCPKCGAENDDNAWKCVKCGAEIRPGAQVTQQPAANIPNYLIFAILVTIFCCLPFGIPAIVFAAQVNSKIASGDVDGATESSRKAKMWCWISFGAGLCVVVIWILLALIGGLSDY